ncbi:MAG: FAD-binding domain-containing protein [Pseudomonadota bacterium]
MTTSTHPPHQPDLLDFGTESAEATSFTPTRAAGLAKLKVFVPKAGSQYQRSRNYDFGPDRRTNVSCLSPYIRHRLISEVDVLGEVLDRHTPNAAEKFIQEVFWRTYFKGWLEHRPGIWKDYQHGVSASLSVLSKDGRLRKTYDDAVSGRTGIDGFDAWAVELVETGYLHNHARMWFASIWIFTLQLPWHLGADFFLRHLIDGDPASNTLGWRWVAGLHTKGKVYQARASNIEKYTDGRFDPRGQLEDHCLPLYDEADETLRPPRDAAGALPSEDYLLIVTEDDGSLELAFPLEPAAALGLVATEDRSVLPVGRLAKAFAHGAVTDALHRGSGSQSAPIVEGADWADAIISACESAGVRHAVTAFLPAGPAADRMASAHNAIKNAGITIHQMRRRYDTLAWPHTTKSFFGLKKKIDSLLPRVLDR